MLHLMMRKEKVYIILLMKMKDAALGIGNKVDFIIYYKSFVKVYKVFY